MFAFVPDEMTLQMAWEPPLDAKTIADEYRARFTVDADSYVVGFSRIPTVGVSAFYVTWDLNRGRVSWWQAIKMIFHGRADYDRTGFGSQKGMGYTIRVLGSVFSAVREFVRVIHPCLLCYDKRDEALGRFHALVAKKFAPQVGYRYEEGGLIVRHSEMNQPAVRRAMQQHREGRTPFTI